MDPHHLLLISMLAVVWLVGWVAAVISIASTRGSITSGIRVVWIALVLVFPVLGPVAWFIGARPYYVRSAAALRA